MVNPQRVQTQIEAGFLGQGLPEELIKEMLLAYAEAKRRFHLGDFMPNAVEGGRFSEAVLRILEWATTDTYTSLGDARFKPDAVIKKLEPQASQPDSIRLHIPRALRVVYDVRNRRNTGHLRDGIDPNIQDATHVVGVMDWVMAELVRLYHSVPPAEAQILIEELVSREIPMIEVFNGRPRVLKDITARDECLVFLSWAGKGGLSRRELAGWLPRSRAANLNRTLASLSKDHLVDQDPASGQIVLTWVGHRYVAEQDLIAPL